MTLEGAVIQEQGIRLANVIVKRHVVQNRLGANRSIAAFSPHFEGVLVVLMPQDHRGVPTYIGRPDVVPFLANTPVESIPWSRFTLS